MHRTTNDSLAHRMTAPSGIFNAPGPRLQAQDPASQAAPHSGSRRLHSLLCSGARASAAVETLGADGWQRPKLGPHPLLCSTKRLLQSPSARLPAPPGPFLIPRHRRGEEGREGREGKRTTLIQAQKYIREFVWSVNATTHRTT